MSPRPGDAVAWQALERTADGVAVFAPDWTIAYINPAGAAVLDRSVEQLTGRGMWETFPEAVGTDFHTHLLAAAAAGRDGEPVRWSAYYGPVQRVPAVEPLHVVLDGGLPALRRARRALAAWLEQLDLDPDQVDNVLMAASEAVTNALEHAYPAATGAGPADPAPVTFDAALGADGVLRVGVGDRGRWRRPPVEPGDRGRGLQMMRVLVDTVVLDHDRPGGGTRVVLSQRLTRPAVFGTAARTTTHRGPSDLELEVERGGRPVLRARGVVDMVTAPVLRQQLLDVGRGGVVPVLLDLDGLHQLASAGVAVLHELRGQCDLRLRVRAGSPVARVLALTGLDDLVVPAPAPPPDTTLVAPPGR